MCDLNSGLNRGPPGHCACGGACFYTIWFIHKQLLRWKIVTNSRDIDCSVSTICIRRNGLIENGLNQPLLAD